MCLRRRWRRTLRCTTVRGPRRQDPEARRADSAACCPPRPTCGADLVIDADRHLVGVLAVRPHALPEHGGGPGRRRRGAPPEAPGPGEDTGRGLALTTDGNHLWGAVDPYVGGVMTVCESVMNLAVVGAWPLAMVNCLNFGNPEHPEVMWQLSESIDGLSEALAHLGIPCVGGNVSLYNEPAAATSTRHR